MSWSHDYWFDEAERAAQLRAARARQEIQQTELSVRTYVRCPCCGHAHYCAGKTEPKGSE